MAEYIEKEALMRRIKEIHCAECDNYHGVRCRACWVDDTLDYIDSEPAADVECGGRLRGVTYEDGKVTAVHIRDTDDVVKVFVPVQHGRWLGWGKVEHRLMKITELAPCAEKTQKYTRNTATTALIVEEN